MSNDVWTYRETLIVDTGIDITGYEVEATDGSIGKIDEATYATGSSYLVVDTGPWIFGKKVMLPAGVVREIDPEQETVFVDRTKDEIKNAPHTRHRARRPVSRPARLVLRRRRPAQPPVRREPDVAARAGGAFGPPARSARRDWPSAHAGIQGPHGKGDTDAALVARSGLVVLAIGGGVALSKFLFLVLVIALILALFGVFNRSTV